ncbi:hypothetical protein NLI96_g4440 [Meripilus lineatus]|uniref:Uncharacterized protein n=1 Tax=Meripilus lineatus TaxID=2056292 RepID=A0AAD5YK41_9APHY|nr:hypothetical protein NLI96_g4440 [Physisporinus lineatus]
MTAGPSSSEPLSQGLGETSSTTPHAPPPVQPINKEPHFPDPLEARYYYWGLPSTPFLLVRSAIKTKWEKQYGGEAAPKVKEIRPFEPHAIQKVWEGKLALEIIRILDSQGIEWTSIDVVRFGWSKEIPSFLTLWIGIMEPDGFDSIDVQDRQQYLRKLGAVIPICLDLLADSYHIFDVEVEFRHSIFTKNGTLKSPSIRDKCPDAQVPLVTAVGHPISSSVIRGVGSGGFFFNVSGKRDRLLLVTARHVLFSPINNPGLYDNRDGRGPRYDVVLIGHDKAFQSYIAKVEESSKREEAFFNRLVNRMGPPDYDTPQAMNSIHESLDKRIALVKLRWELKKYWDPMDNRILGRILYAPPNNTEPAIRVPPPHNPDATYPDDWAVIEIDSAMIKNFDGNVLDLGTKFSDQDRFDLFSNAAAGNLDRLLELKNYIPKAEINTSLMVLKRGFGTNLTVGQIGPMDMPSYYVEYNPERSICLKGWPITPLPEQKPFSNVGDSGSVIVDSDGRLCGILLGGLTRGEGSPQFITYTIPICHLIERMKSCGFKRPNVQPSLRRRT